MTSDEIRGVVQAIAEHVGASALGVAVVLPDGTSTFCTIVARNTDTPEHALFGKLANELYTCAAEAELAAKRGRESS